MRIFLLLFIKLFLAVVVSAQTLTTLVKFNGTNGNLPQSTLIQASDGSFYGTTTGTGINGDYGTIFKMTSEGVLTTLVDFDITNNGGAPWSGVIQASDGNFYGFGGFGVIKMTLSGVVTDLVNVNNNSINFGGSYGNLTQGNDGNLYGIGFGGLYNKGMIFKMTTNGMLTDLADFNGTDGSYNYVYSGLTLGKDGDFYGATGGGGDQFNDGVIFHVTTNGSLALLFSFSGTNGALPYGGLMQASDGNFYGTTFLGGDGYGTVFRMTSDGILTTLVKFNNVHGGPAGRLIQASDGNLYGTTSTSIFKMDLKGILTTLFSFNQTNGAACQSGLTEGGDGNLYGTTSEGGDLSLNYGYGYGTIFKITGLNLLPSFQSIILTNGNVNLVWNSVSNWTYRVQYKTSLSNANWTDLSGDVLATNTVSSKTDAAVPTGRFYRLVLLR